MPRRRYFHQRDTIASIAQSAQQRLCEDALGYLGTAQREAGLGRSVRAQTLGILSACSSLSRWAAEQRAVKSQGFLGIGDVV